jgi:hypothetical protein
VSTPGISTPSLTLPVTLNIAMPDAHALTTPADRTAAAPPTAPYTGPAMAATRTVVAAPATDASKSRCYRPSAMRL